jgi:hypothetical protein
MRLVARLLSRYSFQITVDVWLAWSEATKPDCDLGDSGMEGLIQGQVACVIGVFLGSGGEGLRIVGMVWVEGPVEGFGFYLRDSSVVSNSSSKMNKQGGLEKVFQCPHANCKRWGFCRAENLNEHRRSVEHGQLLDKGPLLVEKPRVHDSRASSKNSGQWRRRPRSR